jgi:hypothetical protein
MAYAQDEPLFAPVQSGGIVRLQGLLQLWRHRDPGMRSTKGSHRLGRTRGNGLFISDLIQPGFAAMGDKAPDSPAVVGTEVRERYSGWTGRSTFPQHGFLVSFPPPPAGRDQLTD